MESTNILLTPNLKSTSLKIEELEKEKERRIKRKKYKAQIKSILSATSLQFILHPIRSKRILIKIFK